MNYPTGTKHWNGRWYLGFTLKDVVFRPGALDMLKHPSRMGNKLYVPEPLGNEPQRDQTA